VNEKIAPLLPEFPYLFKDLVYVGKGFDYLVIDGLSEGKIRDIVLLEIKSGKSQLNKNERMIRDAVKAGKVSYQVLRMK
jgi:predicted Holliday junction resolvase-like endonuclease